MDLPSPFTCLDKNLCKWKQHQIEYFTNTVVPKFSLNISSTSSFYLEIKSSTNILKLVKFKVLLWKEKSKAIHGTGKESDRDTWIRLTRRFEFFLFGPLSWIQQKKIHYLYFFHSSTKRFDHTISKQRKRKILFLLPQEISAIFCAVLALHNSVNSANSIQRSK